MASWPRPLRSPRVVVLLALFAASLIYNVLILTTSRDAWPIRGEGFVEETFCKVTLNHVGFDNALDYVENGLNDLWWKTDFEKSLIKDVIRCVENYVIANVSRNGVARTSLLRRKTPREFSDLRRDWDDVINEVTEFNKSHQREVGSEHDTVKNLLDMPVINPHDYQYIYNQPHACSQEGLKYIIAVPSAPEYFDHRRKVRDNRAGKFVSDPKNGAKMLFFLGNLAPSNAKFESVLKRLQEEERKYKDIVQCDFIDNFKNLTKKASLILRWSVSHCKKSTFVIRMDDDLRVDFSKVTGTLEEYSRSPDKNPHFIVGNVVKDWGPVRSKRSKYFTSVQEYPHKKLPPFILGGSMAYSVATAGLLFQAYKRLKIFWLDDVFITAMCAPKVGVSIYNSSAFVFEHWKW